MCKVGEGEGRVITDGRAKKQFFTKMTHGMGILNYTGSQRVKHIRVIADWNCWDEKHKADRQKKPKRRHSCYHVCPIEC